MGRQTLLEERMLDADSTSEVLLGRIRGHVETARRSRVVAGCVAIGLMSIGARICVPVPGSDVPMTLQSLALLLIGLGLPAAVAMPSLVAYLAIGTAGVPVFAAGSSGCFGPTGGYLVGFVVAAWLMSALRGKGRASVARTAAAGSAGMAILFVCGVAWRAVLFGGDFEFAAMTGFVPFAAKACVQVAIVTTLLAGLRRGQGSPDRQPLL